MTVNFGSKPRDSSAIPWHPVRERFASFTHSCLVLTQNSLDKYAEFIFRPLLG